MKEKLRKAGLGLTTIEAFYRGGGTKALLTVIGLPEAFEEIGDKASKPRVTKNVKIISAIVIFFFQTGVLKRMNVSVIRSPTFYFAACFR